MNSRREPVLSVNRTASLVLILAIMVAGCIDDAEVVVDRESEPLPFERIARGQRALFRDTLEVRIEGSDRWNELKPSLNVAADAMVDFDQEMVLLAAVPAPSGGYDVQIRSVEILAEEVVVHYALGVPADDCITTLGETVPFDAVTVRRTDLPVVFERVQEPIRCTFR